MAEEFLADPDGLREQSAKLDGLGSEYQRMASDLRAEVGHGGDALTHGDSSSFWAQFERLVESLEAKAGLLKRYGDHMRTVADTSQASDEA